MTEVYEYPRMINGETKREFVFLGSSTDCDKLQAVHDAAVDLCLKNENRHICGEDGLSFGQIMDIITPEALAPYGVTMKRIDEMSVQTDRMPPLVSKYELETARNARRAEERRAREVVDYAERAARRLVTQKAQQHPIVSTWDPGKIAVRAASWAWQFILSTEKDFGKFFETRLQAMQTHHAYRDLVPDQSSDYSAEDFGADTAPFPCKGEAVGGLPIAQ